MNLLNFILFSIILPSSLSVDQKGGLLDCLISPYDDLSPIVLLHNQIEYLYPTGDDSSLTFSVGESVDLVCPGGKVTVGSTSYKPITTASCVGLKVFQINNKQVSWRDISCDTVPVKTARYTGQSCENDGQEIEIGFDLTNKFLRTILICFDQSKQQAMYSYVKIPQSINKGKSEIRPSWLQGTKLFNITSVDSYYKRVNQRKTINNLLKLAENSTDFIQDNDYFLARGHLTAKMDNFYPSQQNQTFFLINAVPQWQIINEHNWYKVESSVRDYAEANKVDLMQWTGVYGVLSAKNANNRQTKLYLYAEGEQYLPVPEYFWKVAYDPLSQKGIAIVGLNDPYTSKSSIFCKNVSSKVGWINVEWNNVAKGLIFVCEINDFRKTVTYLPQFTVKGLLV